MDFNSLDEQSPLADYWQMNDGLDTEDAAVIASLATQALQAKLGYDYEDSMGVNEPAEVANYTESRSSPQSQSQYSIAHEEPAESFRGLMDDHDRGAQFSGAEATNEYDMEPPARGRVSDTVAGFEEQAAFMRDFNPHDPIYSLLNVSTEMDDMRGTRTASQIVNELLRNSELAASQSQTDVNMQAAHSQAAQLTPPDSESPSISAEEHDHRELEEIFLADAREQHGDDCEPEDVISEKPLLDTEAQQQLMAESDERPTTDEDEMDVDESREPSPSPAPRKARRPRKSDTPVELPDLVPEESNVIEMTLREQVVVEGDEMVEPAVVEEAVVEEAVVEKVVVEEAVVEEAVAEETVAEETVAEETLAEEAAADGADTNKAEETPAARRRGRPRKSENLPEQTRASSTKRTSSMKRGPGRPPKLAAPEATNESTPATGKRGRPRKSEVEEQSQIHPEEADEPIEEAPTTTPAAGRRGRPRRSEVEDQPQMLTEKPNITPEEAPVAATAPGKRGRPRKSGVEDKPQAHTEESDTPAEATPAATPAAGKRGRPRKSETGDQSQAHTTVIDKLAEEAPATRPATGKRGRPRKSEVGDKFQAHTEETDAPAEETPTATVAAGKRGRPRKSEVEDKSQAQTEEPDTPAEETPTVTATAGKRGRPRRNTLVDVIQAPTEAPQPPVVETSSSTPSLSKRGRPRRSEMVEMAHNSTDEHTLTATEATNSTPAPARRGRPRKSEVMSTPQIITDEYALSATETAVSTSAPTPAPGKRGRPRKSDAAQVSTHESQPSIVETPTITPTGRRGRPRKSDAVSAIAPKTSAVPELQAESETSTTAAITPSITENMEQRNRPFGQDEALDEQHVPLFIAPVQKRGRGRPPKSGVLVNSTTDPAIAADIEVAELQGSNSDHTEGVAEDMAVNENLGTEPVPDIWEIQVTPAKKRGRPKSVAMDNPLPMNFAHVTASAKKRGRPPKAPTTEESAETLEKPSQPEAVETEDRVAKRRRTDSDIAMEGSIDALIESLLSDKMEEAVEEAVEETQPEAREERPVSARKRRVSFAADTKIPKSLIPVKFLRRNSDSTGLKAGFFSINTPRTPRLGGPTDGSKENSGAEMPVKSTAMQQTELFLSRLPRPTVKSVFDGNKFGKRPKTYGKRLKK